MFFKRMLNLKKLLQQKSHFLLGPRSTGKSFWMKKSLSPKLYINLLEQDTLRELLIEPSRLRQRILGRFPPQSLIIIDEIQKAPHLLDEVHYLIEDQQIRFLLTGSSARKLKRGAVNLLAGRAWMTGV